MEDTELAQVLKLAETTLLEMFGMLKIKNHQAHISKNNG